MWDSQDTPTHCSPFCKSFWNTKVDLKQLFKQLRIKHQDFHLSFCVTRPATVQLKNIRLLTIFIFISPLFYFKKFRGRFISAEAVTVRQSALHGLTSGLNKRKPSGEKHNPGITSTKAGYVSKDLVDYMILKGLNSKLYTMNEPSPAFYEVTSVPLHWQRKSVLKYFGNTFVCILGNLDFFALIVVAQKWLMLLLLY